MLKRSLILMMMLIAFAACKSAKNGMPGCTGTGCNYHAEGKSGLQYLSYMYDPSRGLALNEQVINIPEYTLLKDEIQAAVDLMMKFPYQTGTGKSRADITHWYDSVPADIKNAYANSLAVAMEKYFQSPEGKNYVQSYLTQLNSSLTQIAQTGDTSQSFNYEAYVKLAGSAAMLLSGLDATTAISLGISAIGSIFGGGDDEMAAVMAQLQQIMNQLKSIQEQLNKIETIVLNVELAVQGAPLEDAKNFLKTMSNYLNDTNLTMVKKNLFDNINDYNSKYINAFNSAQQTMGTNAGLIKESENGKFSISQVDGYKILFNKNQSWVIVNRSPFDGTILSRTMCPQSSDVFGECFGNGNTLTTINNILTQTLTFKNPAYYVYGPVLASTSRKGISLEDAAFLKRYSLIRLAFLEKMYEGDELIERRKYYAQIWDKPIVDVLKERVKSIIAEAESEYIINDFDLFDSYTYNGGPSSPLVTRDPSAENVLEDNWYNNGSYNNGSGGSIGRVKYNVKYDLMKLVDSQNNTWENKNSYNYKQYQESILGCGDIVCVSAVSASNIFPIAGDASSFQAQRKQVIKEYIYKTRPEFRDYIVAYAALLADWEIQLNAHIKVYEELQKKRGLR